MSYQLSDEWKSAMFRILERPGLTMVVGMPDVGKSTFSAALAGGAAVKAIASAVVDADPGQSEIGPPTTVGWGWVKGPVNALSGIPCEGIHFIGSTSPEGYQLRSVQAILRLVELARREGASQITIDLPGYAVGSRARTYITGLIDVVQPDHLVYIQKRREMEPLASAFKNASSINFQLVPASSLARVRSTSERSTRRRLNFGSYFSDGRQHVFDCTEVALEYSPLFAGVPLGMSKLLELQAQAGRQALYAEYLDGRIIAVLPSGADRPGSAQVFSGRRVTFVPDNWLDGILVGLADANGRHHAVGRIESVDYAKRRVTIYAPLQRAAIINKLSFGGIRVDRSGQEGSPLPSPDAVGGRRLKGVR